MKDIDFIKWKFEKAGTPFKVNVYPNCTTIVIPGKEHAFFIEEFESICPDYIKSLLSQKAIDGVNSDGETDYNIKQDHTGVFVTKLYRIGMIEKNRHSTVGRFYNTGDLTQAKESALQYIFEQEAK